MTLIPIILLILLSIGAVITDTDEEEIKNDKRN